MIPIKDVLISCKEVDVEYYIKLGYDVPLKINKKGKQVKPKGVKFKVKLEDLLDTCAVSVPKYCDICGKFCGDIQYNQIINSRKNGDGQDFCFICSRSKASSTQMNNVKSNGSLSEKAPELLNEWNYYLNLKTPCQVSYGSSYLYWWTCERCGSNFEMSPNKRVVSNRGCPYCAGQKVNHTNCIATTHPHLVKEWHSTLNKNHTPFNTSKGTHIEIYWICQKCNNLFTMSPNTRTSMNCGCPLCNESKGEKKIRKWLEQNNIIFKSQYEFEDLIGLGEQPLKFDFAIFNANNELSFLIEYDGEFHYEKQYEEDKHERTIIHDSKKNNYCGKFNISLLRIPYWNFNKIEEILKNRFIEEECS